MNKTVLSVVLLIGLVFALIFFTDFFRAPAPPQDGSNNEGNTLERQIQLYYYNPNNDKDGAGNVMCSRAGLVPVARRIPVTSTPVQDAVKLLLRGELLESEKNAGITTEFPLPALELVGADLDNGILTLEFSDPNNVTSGGACRAGILWFQVEVTAKQFPEVNEVRYLPETLFQP